MAQITITIDNRVEFKGELGDWVQKPPDFIRDRIKPGAKMEPHMKGVLMAVTDAVMLNKSTSITVKTWINGWSMTVDWNEK